MNLWVMLESVRFIMLHAVFKEFRSKCSWTKPYTQEVSYHMMVSWVSSFSGAKTPLIGDLSSFSLEKALGVKYQFLLINTNIHVCQQTPNTRQFHSVGGKRCRKPCDIAPSIFSVDGPFIQRTYFRIPPQKYVYIYIYIHTIYSIYICYTPPPPKDRPVPWFFSS